MLLDHVSQTSPRAVMYGIVEDHPCKNEWAQDESIMFEVFCTQGVSKSVLFGRRNLILPQQLLTLSMSTTIRLHVITTAAPPTAASINEGPCELATPEARSRAMNAAPKTAQIGLTYFPKRREVEYTPNEASSDRSWQPYTVS